MIVLICSGWPGCGCSVVTCQLLLQRSLPLQLIAVSVAAAAADSMSGVQQQAAWAGGISCYSCVCSCWHKHAPCPAVVVFMQMRAEKLFVLEFACSYGLQTADHSWSISHPDEPRVCCIMKLHQKVARPPPDSMSSAWPGEPGSLSSNIWRVFAAVSCVGLFETVSSSRAALTTVARCR